MKETILHDVETRKYQIKIAKTEEEVDSALRLRYRVFGRELDRNFRFKGGRDKDKYDDQCHHLIVIEKSSGRAIGTYRLQTYEQAMEGKGFYTTKRFNLNQLPDHVLKNSFEVGRACIEDEHRNGRVLFLLWKGLAGYLEYFQKRYMFGYAALDTTDMNVAFNTYYYLKEKGHLHRDYHVEINEGYRFDENQLKKNKQNGKIDIPPLLKNYLQVGTQICSKPAFDQKLNLIHFFILLDIETITEKTRKMFFG